MKKITLTLWMTLGLCALSVNAQIVSTAGSRGFAMCSNGTVNAWGSGGLGNGTSANSLSPILIDNLTNANVASIECGYSHTFAIKNDGTLWGWGWNNRGQVGDGTTTNPYAPVQIVGMTGVIDAAGGYGHSLAVKNDDTVWAWGANESGQLGDGTETDQLTPVQVIGLTGIIAVSAGSRHSMALKNDGTVWTWGANWSGQLGNGNTSNNGTPTQLSGLTGITQIAGADGHSLILKNDGTVWAFGENSAGQIGDGIYGSRLTPSQVSGLTGITAITGNEEGHSMALKSDGTVWTWGSNFNGQLGIGTSGAGTNRTTPVQVSTLSGMTAISGGRYFSLAVKNDGTVWTWGANSGGSLGTGTSASSTVPVQVINLCTTLAIEEVNDTLTFKMYPNPSNGQFQLNFEHTPSEAIKLEIYSVLGSKLYASTIHNQNNPIDISNLSNGLYIVKLFEGSKTYSQKIVIQN